MSQSGCALVTMTAGRVRRRWSRRDEKGWMDKSHSRLDKTRRGRDSLDRAVWWFGRGVVSWVDMSMSAVQNLSGVRGATTMCERSPSF